MMRRRFDDTDVRVPCPNEEGTCMKKTAAVFAGTMVFLTMLAGSALAAYSEPPETEAVVEGAGGSGGTAFTGGDASTLAIMAIALVAVGLVALFVARRRTATTS
jgi:LPXTG-motif cell wall-anchored protein